MSCLLLDPKQLTDAKAQYSDLNMTTETVFTVSTPVCEAMACYNTMIVSYYPNEQFTFISNSYVTHCVVGLAHVIFLNGYTNVAEGSKQYNWLMNDLKSVSYADTMTYCL